MKRIVALVTGLLFTVQCVAAGFPFQPNSVLTASDLNAAFQNAHITSGTIIGAAIDNTPIGQTTPAAGKFTTLQATSEDSTPIGQTTPAAGAFTTLAASSVSVSGVALSSASGASLVGYAASGVGAITQTVQSKNQQSVNVLDFGAACNGSTDDTTAVTNALTASAEVIVPASCNLYTATGITIPAGHVLRGLGFAPSSPATGATVTCALAVANCVTVGGASAANGSASLIGLTVTRVAGTHPVGSVGVLVQNTYNAILRDVNSVSHDIGFYFKSNGISAGISTNAEFIFTCNITDAHVVQDTMAELRIINSRFGCNGTADQTSNAYIRVTGGSTTNAAAGPNTLLVSNSQFNQGNSIKANALIQFSNRIPGAISDNVIWQFSNCHIEANNFGIVSDSTWTNIGRVKLVNNQFGLTAAPIVNLDPASVVNEWLISNNQFAGSFTLAPASQINFLQLANNTFASAVSITGVSNSTVSSVGNTYRNGITFAGNFSQLVSVDEITSGILTDTSTATRKFIKSIGIDTLGGAEGSFRINAPITGNASSIGFKSYGVAQSDVTNRADMFASFSGTQAAAFTLADLSGFTALQNVIGAGSTVTRQEGFWATSGLNGGISNYGFRGSLAAASGAFNLYMDGTAANYLNGAVGLGVVPSATAPNSKLQIGGNSTGNVTMYGTRAAQTVQSDVTSGYNIFSTGPSTQATTFTLAQLVHYRADQGTIGAGSTVTTQEAFLAGDMTGATNNYGFVSGMTAGAGKLGFYNQGNADNNLGTGKTTIGSLASTALLSSSTAPAIASGFGTSPSVTANNGTAAFTINVGTGGTASSGVVTMPAATTGWACSVMPNGAPQAGAVMYSAPTSTTSITITNYTQSTAAALAWPASAVISVKCIGY